VNGQELIEQYRVGQRDFSRADLREANLHGADLCDIKLEEANLRGANLRSAILRNAVLRGAILCDTSMYGADLRGADLGEANLGGTNLQEAFLYGADLRGANLSGANLLDTTLVDANLCMAKVTNEQLARAMSLQGAIMPDGTKMASPAAQKHEYRDKRMSGGELVKLYRAGKRDFHRVIVRRHGARRRGRGGTRGADLYEANLSEADFSKADFIEADLSGANLSRANLSGADLNWARLYSANLSEADLRGASLHGAKLHGANLSEANLLDANLHWADLSGAILRGAKVTAEQLARARSLEGAVMADSTRPDSLGHDVGSEPAIVPSLPDDSLRQPEVAILDTQEPVGVQEALEGKTYRAEVTFRRRNRSLIEAKKAASDGRCEVCGFSFEDYYGAIGRDCVVAHHINPIAHRSGPSRTSLDDIALLCPNCHAAVHTQDPPISLDDLRKMLREQGASHGQQLGTPISPHRSQHN